MGLAGTTRSYFKSQPAQGFARQGLVQMGLSKNHGCPEFASNQTQARHGRLLEWMLPESPASRGKPKRRLYEAVRSHDR
jgi:hypothetical protein